MPFLKMLDDLLFPPRCAVCDDVLLPDGRRICEDCRGKLHYVKGPTCLKCGKGIRDEEQEFCWDCGRRKRSFERGFPVFQYVPPVSDAMAMMKYHGRAEYADFYGEEIVKRYGESLRALKPDCLIPIPVHRKRLRKRGYNQAECLAKAVGERLGVAVRTDILYRVENTVAQKKLSDVEREQNLSHAFRAIRTERMPETVLLVDDIYTSGATMECCTRMLLSIGIKKVYYTSVCIGKTEE